MEASDLISLSNPVKMFSERCRAIILDIYFSRSRTQEGCACRRAILLIKRFILVFWGRDNLPSHPSRFWSDVCVASCLLRVCVGIFYWLFDVVNCHSHFEKPLIRHAEAILSGIENLTSRSGNSTMQRNYQSGLFFCYGYWKGHHGLLHQDEAKYLKRQLGWLLLAVCVWGASGISCGISVKCLYGRLIRGQTINLYDHEAAQFSNVG